MARYIANVQRQSGPEDSGWGLHVEGPSTVFGTALNYVALRLLGVPAEEQAMRQAQQTLFALGDARASPSWAKFWLALLNLYDWEGVNPVPVETLYLSVSLALFF